MFLKSFWQKKCFIIAQRFPEQNIFLAKIFLGLRFHSPSLSLSVFATVMVAVALTFIVIRSAMVSTIATIILTHTHSIHVSVRDSGSDSSDDSNSSSACHY